MKNFLCLLFLSILVFLSACNQSQLEPNHTPVRPINEDSQLLRLDFNFLGEYPTAKIHSLNPLTLQVLEDVGNGLQISGDDRVALTNIQHGGKRYISATFEFTNGTNRDLESVYFIAADPNHNPPQKPFGNVRNFANQPIAVPDSMVASSAKIYDVLTREMKVASYSDYIDSIDLSNAVVTERENLFNYGFLGKNISRNSTEIAQGAKGQVTFSTELDDLTGGDNDPYHFSLYFHLATPQPETLKVCDGSFWIDETDTGGDIAKVRDCSQITGALSVSNTSLEDLSFLSHLTSVGEYMEIFNNDNLKDLKGLENLTSITNSLTIMNNDSLISFEGLDKLTVLGGLMVDSNPALTTITLPTGLTTIGGTFQVAYNDALNNFNGFDNVVLIDGDFAIVSNKLLINISALNNINEITGNARITYNAQFSCSPYNVNPPGYFPLNRSVGNLVDCNTQ